MARTAEQLDQNRRQQGSNRTRPELRFPPVRIQAQKDLTAGAQKHYRRLAKMLADAGAFTAGDVDAVRQTAQSLDLVDTLEAELAKYGVADENGKPSRLLSALNEQRRLALAWLRSLGLTAKSRGTMRTQGPLASEQAAGDSLEQFLAGRVQGS